MAPTESGVGPTVALAHDYLTQRGGAERVAAIMATGFPSSPLYTSVYEPSQTFPAFGEFDVRTSHLQAIPPLRRNPRLALPLLAPTFSTMQVDADVVIASSSGWAHGIGTEGEVIVYCHAPARWLYQPQRYQGSLRSKGSFRTVATAAAAGLGPMLRRWDQRAAHRAALYLVNSRAVATMVHEAYGIDAEVLSPPPALDADGPLTPVPGIDAGFVLSVSRLLPYKNVDVVFEMARRRPDLEFIHVGGGPLRAQLEAQRPSNVRMLDAVTDDQLRWLYHAAVVLIAPSYEDFGLTPLEAASCGTPTIALRAGGYLDTIIDRTTGLLFDELEPSLIAVTLDRLLADPPDQQVLRSHAASFSRHAFIERLQDLAAAVSPIH